MTFWEKPPNKVQKPWENPEAQPDFELNEEAMTSLQEDPNVDIFDDEEDDTQAIMSDANLRLEQGRLYQMVLQGDIFADTNADPKAIRNVQREIRKFVRERMETMLGIRQESPTQETVVSSPFNDLEVTVLKMLASKVSNGKTEESQKNEPAPQAPPAPPKKDGITSISGSLRPQTTTPLSSKPKTPVKAQPKQAPAKQLPKSAIKAEEEGVLQKPIDQMTDAELVAHDKAALDRRARNHSAIPTNMTPHPTPQQLEMMYTQAATNLTIANAFRVNGQ